MGGLFKDMLSGEESLYRDEMALDTEYMPPVIKYRENQQQHIATCIKPLFQRRNGKNVLIVGSPGIGKTVAVKHVLNELQQETDEVIPLYVNCWKKDSPYKIALEFCNQVGFKFVANRDTSELLREVTRILNKKCAVIVLDEADKITDDSLFYSLLEDVYRKTIILITNEKEWLATMDQRIRSRLMPDILEFQPYTAVEIQGILKQRVEYAFVLNALEDDAFELIAQKTYEMRDVRSGLFLLKEACALAELRSSRRILRAHAEESLKKLDNFRIKSTSNLDADENLILQVVQAHTGKISSEVYSLYQENGGKQSYSSFQRKLKNLERGKFVTLKDLNRGLAGGRVTIVEYGVQKA